MASENLSPKKRSLRANLLSPSIWIPLIGVISISLALYAIFANKSPAQGFSDSPHTNQSAPQSEPDSIPRALAVFDSSLLVRASGGTCSSPAYFEVSGDNGSSWLAIDAANTANFGAIFGINIVTPSNIEVVGYDNRSCDIKKASSTTGGITWERQSLSELTYFDLNDPDFYVFEDENIELPCTARYAAKNNSSLAVLCANNTIITSDDEGEIWAAAVDSPQAQTLVFSQDKLFAVNVNTEQCKGATLALVAENKLGANSNCLTVEKEFNPAATSATSTDSTIYLWLSDTFATTTDAGATWK